MGGLRRLMPVTFATYAIGMMALSGVPLFFSGFWSKDAILHAARNWNGSRLPFYLGIFGALLTAFYMTRQVCYVFFGSFRGNPQKAETEAHARRRGESTGLANEGPHAPNESPRVMTLPLVILAAGSVLLGFIGTPAWPWFQNFLEPLRERENDGVLPVMILSSLVVFLGIGIGWWFYGRRPLGDSEQPDVLERLWPDIYALLRRKYFVDEVYEWAVVGLNARFAQACALVEEWVWNGVVLTVACLVIGLSWVERLLDEQVVNRGFDKSCQELKQGGGFLSRLQNGQTQSYLRIIGIGLVVLALFLIWGCHAS